MVSISLKALICLAWLLTLWSGGAWAMERQSGHAGFASAQVAREHELPGRTASGSSALPVSMGAAVSLATLLLACGLGSGRREDSSWDGGDSRYRQLFNDASDGIIILDDQGRISDLNKAICAMLGYTAEELLGVFMPDLINPDDLKRYAFSLDRVAGGRTLSVERPVRCKDGSYRVLEIRAKRVGSGVVQALCRDISERRKAEEARRQAQEHYRVLFSSNSQGILAADSRTAELVLVNPAICAMLGYSEEELLSLRVADIHPAEAQKRVQTELRAAARGEKTHGSEIPIKRKDGSVFYADVAGATASVQGRECIFGFFTDVTERKKAEDALRESERRFRAILDTSYNLAGLLTPEGRVLVANQAALDLVGVTQDEVVGKPFWETPWWADDRAQQESLAQALLRAQQGEFVRLEVKHRNVDGEEVVVDFNLKPVEDNEGRVVQLVAEGRDITERTRMEEELLVNRDRLRLAQQIANVGNWELDLATGRVWGSDQAFRIYGLEPNPSRSLPYEAIKAAPLPEHRAELDEAMRALVERGASYSMEFRFRRACDGVIRQVHSKAELIRDAKGAPAKVVGTIQDITERKQIEDSLRLTQFAFDSASVGIFRIGDDGRILSVNETACRSLGYTRQELLGMNVFDIDPAFPCEIWPEHIQNLRQVGTRTIETMHRRKDGELFPVEIIINYMEFGGEEFHLAFVQDITERKQIEDSLRLTQFSFDRAAVGITRVGRDARILGVNDALCQILRYSREELLGMTVFDFNPDFSPEMWPEHVENLRQAGSMTVETIHQRKNGETFPAEVSMNYMEYQGKEFHIAFHQDISERKRLEEERESLERQLVQAQKMEAIGNLAGGIAHDFNNILTAISGFTEMAQMAAGKQDDPSPALAQVLAAADRARDLVRQILTFSRRGEAHKKPLDVNQLITQTLLMLQSGMSKMVTLETELAPDMPLVMADATQMEQLVMNLALNARDAMPEGGRLSIETKVLELDQEYARRVLDVAPGPHLQIVFTDTGQGMDPETVEHIFDPFFTTKRPGEGTGLGLSTAYGVVKSHGGRITCYSEKGKGTVFRVYLPLHEAATEPEARGMELSLSRMRGTETILLVDDEATLRELGSETLKGVGYQVLTADSGEAALETCAALGSQLDLVVLDLGMPGMGGVKCLGEIKALDPSAKVIVMSGYASKSQNLEVEHMGAAGFVPKPFRISEFLGTVRAVLDG